MSSSLHLRFSVFGLALLAVGIQHGCVAKPPADDSSLTGDSSLGGEVALSDDVNDGSNRVDDTGEKAEDAGVSADSMAVDAGELLDSKTADATTPQDTEPQDTTSQDTASQDTASQDIAPQDIAPQDTEPIADTTASQDAGSQDAAVEDAPSLDVGSPPDSGDSGADAVGPPAPCTKDVDCTPDKPCRIPKCMPDGICKSEIAPDDVPCNPGHECFTESACFKGQCQTDKKICKGITCHTAACDKKTGACIQTPGKVGAFCNDGLPCTSTDRCVAGGKCVGKPRPEGSSCAGKAWCKVHKCTNNVCLPYKSKVCNDYNQCTWDSCDEQQKDCYHKQKPVGTECDDNLACTEKDACTADYCWGKEIFKGCNGLPQSGCGDLVCSAGEDAESCTVDCHVKGFQAWMLFWMTCKKPTIKCLNDKACVQAGGCVVLCKYPSKPGQSKNACLKLCMDNAPAKSWALYKDVDNCSTKLP